MKNLRFLLCLVLLTCYFFAYSQKHHLKFDHISLEQGLSQSNVLSIRQDSHGFMWFGTRDGLNKYDGYSFKLFKNDPHDPKSIRNNFVMDILTAKNGDLWVATLGGGISRYDHNKENFTNYVHNPKNINSISHDVVHSIIEDEFQNIWIGSEGGLDVLDAATNKFTHFANDPNNVNSLSDSYVRNIFEDSHHNIWIGTLNGGINLFNRKSKTFTHFQHSAGNPKSVASNNISTMFEDSRQRLWIGTDGAGLDFFDYKNNTFFHYKHDENKAGSLSANSVYALNEDAENNLWVGTENGGLSILNLATGLFTTYKNDEIDKQSLINNSIYTIYKDTKNNMWLGTFAGGVELANRDKIKFIHYNHMMLKNSLSDNHVLSIIEDSKKNIWIGTDGGGLNLFDPQKSNFTHLRHKKNDNQSICGDYVLSLCEDSKGNIWIGTWANGITVYNPSKNTYRHFKNQPGNPASLNKNNAWKIFEDKDKNIWVGLFGGGLDLLNPDDKSFTHYNFNKNCADGISSINVVSVFDDDEGRLWVCTDGGGLNRFDKKTKIFTRFLHDDKSNSISNNSVSSVLQASDKNLWIGTRAGLNKYDKKSNRFTVYTIADGLPDNVIFGILEDDKKNLWISTNKGISCFDLTAKVFKNFGVSDGLQSNEFKTQAACKTLSGMMFFGGNNGFNQFFPDSVRSIPFEPSLVITNFQIFNKKVSVALNKNDPSPLTKSITETKTITLSYSDAVFSFEFATLNYTASEKKRYEYKLEGFDKDWNEAGSARMATYTNLDPGKYLFKVKGLNNEGNWSANVTCINLIIKPPLWLTWWFKLLCFLAIIGSVIGFYFIRINAVRAQKTKLQLQVKEQTRQLVISTYEEKKARAEAEQANFAIKIANQELKIKNKELEQFAYVASHDLQEPLRTTAGFVNLLQQQYHGKLDEKADKYLNYISEAANRMKVLIKDLLDFSRIGTNVELKKIDCNIIMKDMLADISVAIQESKAEIQYSELPLIYGSSTEIKLLFQNLVINAIKFRRKDITPQIKISAVHSDDYWRFAISDNGIGIEAKNSDKIFDIFQRLHTRTEYEGSGIGLSHCKKIVELNHGKIWFHSPPGEGTTFYFTLLINTVKFEAN